MKVVMRSSDVAVEDVTLASSLHSRPIRWISFTFVRLLDFEFEQGHHIPLFRPSLFKIPFYIFFFYCLANIMCNKLGEVRSHAGTEREDNLVWFTFNCLYRFAFNDEEWITTNWWWWWWFYLLRYEDKVTWRLLWLSLEVRVYHVKELVYMGVETNLKMTPVWM